MPIATVRKPDQPVIYVFAVLADGTAIVAYDDPQAERVTVNVEDLV